MSSSDRPTPTIPTSHNVAPVTSTAIATATVVRDVGALTRSDGVRRCPRARRWRRSRPNDCASRPSVLDLGRTPDICTLGRSPPTVSYARTQGWRAGGATAPPLTGAALGSSRRASLGPYMPAKRLREPAARSRMGANLIARLAVGEAPPLRRGIGGPDPLAVYRTLPRSVELPLRSPLRTRDVSGKRRSIGAQGSADRGASVSRPVRIPPRALGRGYESTRRVQGCSPLRVKPRRLQESAASGRVA